ncbi:MAG: sigma-70 family RNA polymerase sigma factor [Acidobacteria bacterium]|nr:sigma-70 family RNA polymerase sigma factor [Acidobacteriota bacterium]
MDRTQDRELVARLQARSDAAVHDLADRYGSRIYQLAYRHLKNREDAEEVAQDVLLKVYRKIGAFRGDAALSSWIYRITFNTAMSRLRRHRSVRGNGRVRPGAEATTPAANVAFGGRPLGVRQPADWSRLPDEALLRRQLREAVATAISELPEIYREPVVLRDIEGLTTEEASSRLRVKDQTLKSRLHRGRLMLRERLRVFATGLTLHGPTPAYG